jgi:hypothetical protein
MRVTTSERCLRSVARQDRSYAFAMVALAIVGLAAALLIPANRVDEGAHELAAEI